MSPVVVVCGPTATGKSELACTLAQRASGCVLSADSMQVYRGMDIGTAKVPEAERRVPHFGLDLVDVDEPYSAALYQSYARSVISEQHQALTPVIMAGGTGLYIQAALDDLRFPEGDQADNPVREKYMALAQEKGSHAVWDVLNSLDEASAEQIHPHNLKRVVRALEMLEAGESYAERAHGLALADPVVPAVFVGLAMDREVLYKRVNARVDRMREEGLIEEVSGLMDAGFEDALTSRQAIGYKEIIDALHGQCSMDEAFSQIKQATRRYAKRQMTWFRREKRIQWLDVTDASREDIVEQAVEALKDKGVS